MKLLAIDGNSIINRAFYGIRLLSTKDGQFTNAVYGFINILNKLVIVLIILAAYNSSCFRANFSPSILCKSNLSLSTCSSLSFISFRIFGISNSFLCI